MTGRLTMGPLPPATVFGVYGPLIRGSQFLLRPPRLDESEVMAAWFEDQEVTAHLQVRLPMTVQAERGWLQRMSDDPNAILHAGLWIDRVLTELYRDEWERRRGA